VTEIVKIYRLFVDGCFVRDRQLYLTENGGAFELDVDQEVPIAGVQPVLHSIYFELRVTIDLIPYFFDFFKCS
jgi:hypothetical protein